MSLRRWYVSWVPKDGKLLCQHISRIFYTKGKCHVQKTNQKKTMSTEQKLQDAGSLDMEWQRFVSTLVPSPHSLYFSHPYLLRQLPKTKDRNFFFLLSFTPTSHQSTSAISSETLSWLCPLLSSHCPDHLIIIPCLRALLQLPNWLSASSTSSPFITASFIFKM